MPAAIQAGRHARVPQPEQRQLLETLCLAVAIMQLEDEPSPVIVRRVEQPPALTHVERCDEAVATEALWFEVTHTTNNDTQDPSERHDLRGPIMSGHVSRATRPRRSAARLLGSLLSCWLLLAASVSADIIHYKDGRKLEGDILEQNDSEVRIDTEFGTITVKMSKIARIEEKATPAQELAERRAEVDDSNARAIYQLALWADEHKLRKESKALLLEVVAADPGHRDANERLGRVKVDDRWLEPDEVDAYLEKVAEEKQAQGLLFHEGKWLPEAEVMKARGFALYHGEWLPRREAETRLAIEDLADLAELRMTATAGESVTVFSVDIDEEFVESLIYDLDAEVRDIQKRLRLNEVEIERVTRYDIPIFLLPDMEASARLVDSGFTRRYLHTDADLEAFRGEWSYGLQAPRPLIVLVEGNHLDRTGDRDEMRTGIISHQVANALMALLKNPRDTPGWAKAGVAAWYEGATNYYATLTLTTNRGGPDGAPLDLWTGGWRNFADFRDNLRDEALLSSVGKLETILMRSSESYTSRDVAVCWSFVGFLFDRHPTELSEYLRVYDTERNTDRNPRRMHERAWPRAFATEVSELEKSWKSWALARPMRFPTDPLGR